MLSKKCLIVDLHPNHPKTPAGSLVMDMLHRTSGEQGVDRDNSPILHRQVGEQAIALFFGDTLTVLPSGQEKELKMKQLLNGTDVVLLRFSLVEPTPKEVAQWTRLMRIGWPGVPVLLLGAELDKMSAPRDAIGDKMKRLQRDTGTTGYGLCCSATTCQGLDDLFHLAARVAVRYPDAVQWRGLNLEPTLRPKSEAATDGYAKSNSGNQQLFSDAVGCGSGPTVTVPVNRRCHRNSIIRNANIDSIEKVADRSTDDERASLVPKVVPCCCKLEGETGGFFVTRPARTHEAFNRATRTRR